MKHLIWSYDYDHASAGPKALHRLCHELRQAGQEAYVSGSPNPDWNTPQSGPLEGDWTAIYPEIVSGNPWNAPHVARWVLNVPGLLGGDTSYDPSEVVFTWDQRFMDAPVLRLQTIETDIYVNRWEQRKGIAYWIGKGVLTEPVDGTLITLDMRRDRHALADVLNGVSTLRSFDPVSAMNLIALMCGCLVYVVPTREWLWPQGPALADYFASMADAPRMIADFIDATSLVPA